MKVDVYVCTKPFQWLNVENIEKRNTLNVLIIIDNFPNVKDIALRIQQFFPHWKEIIIVKNRLRAFLAIWKFDVANLYIDSDYGRKSYLYCFIKANQFVYDEGIGTYSVNTEELFGIKNKIKYYLFKLIGAGTFQGGNWKTEGIIVYNKNFYISRFGRNLKGKVVLPFKQSFENFVNDNLDRLAKVFEFNVYSDLSDKRVALYLTYHNVNQEIIRYLEAHATHFDLVIIKPHPHLLKFGDISIIKNNDYHIFNNPIMAEVLMMKLAEGNDLTVLHESSTACLNLKKSNRMKIIDFKNPLYSKDFDQYIEKLT